MKFSISQNVILKALMLVLGGVGKDHQFSTVKITTGEVNSIKLETRNAEVKITSFINNPIESTGEIAIIFTKLFDIIKKFNSVDIISFEVKDGILLLKSGKSRFTIQGLSSENEGVGGRSEDEGISFEMMSKKLLSIINKTKFSIFPDETRFNLNGLCFHFKEESGTSFLNAVSTDGHRLSLAKIESKIPVTIAKKIIPKKTTLEISKILETLEDEEVEITILKNQITIKSSSFILTSKLIDAEYPDYEKVIPKDNSKIVKINRKDLISIIERSSAVHLNSSNKDTKIDSRNPLNGVKLHLSGNMLTINARGQDLSEFTDEMEVESTFSESFEVSYNYIYLLEILSNIGSEKIVLKLKDEKSQALLTDDAVDNYLYVLMPMRF